MEPTPLDQYENALIVYLKRHHPSSLDGVRAIWGWRCGIAPSDIDVTDIADALYTLGERLNLLGHSLGNYPGGRGGFGVLCDAAPERTWALSLVGGPGAGESQERHYWFRVVSVLCSRLRMAEVAKLPGYDHDATVGPFGVAPRPVPRATEGISL